MEVKYTQRDLDTARLAAYIDGEGSIGLKKSSQGKNRHDKYSLEIVVVNTDLRLLVWIQEIFGGSVRLHRVSTDKHKATYTWKASNEKAGEILSECLPFFVIKRDQAELGIAFRKTFSLKNRTPKGLDSSVEAERESLREKIFVIRRVNNGPKTRTEDAA
jgi:hypothetical protein